MKGKLVTCDYHGNFYVGFITKEFQDSITVRRVLGPAGRTNLINTVNKTVFDFSWKLYA